MTFKKAAEKILTEYRRPLTASELVNIAFERDLINSSGNTPEATMAATLYTDLKSNKKTIFQKIGKGKFALKKQTESATDPLLIVSRQNNLVRESLFQELKKMDPSQFEYLVGDLLQKMGYEDVEVRGKSGDEGVDVIGTLTAGGLTSVPTVVQVKQYKTSNIGPKYIRELRGSAKVGQRGLIVTLSKFTEGAKTEAKADGKMPVSLVDGERLINLLIENQVGIKEEELVILSIDQEYFDNSDSSEELTSEKDKYRVMWPLPGGGDNYLETLDSLLHLIAEGENNQKNLIQWFIDTFDDVSSEKTSSGYLRVPKYMGLIIIKNGRVTLSTEGKEYLRSKDKNYLFKLIEENILVFEDIYGFVKESNTGVSEREILEFLQENFGITWNTYAQVNFRLRWMMNLGKVKKLESGYVSI